MTDLPIVPLTDSVLRYIRGRRPGAAALLEQRGITRLQFRPGGPRTALIFPDLIMVPGEPEWEQFDRQVDTDNAVIVMDGKPHLIDSSIIGDDHMPFDVFNNEIHEGDEFYIDPATLHQPDYMDMGPHAEKRIAKITIGPREAYKVKIFFEDGFSTVFDVDECRCWGRFWVPKEEQHGDCEIHSDADSERPV